MGFDTGAPRQAIMARSCKVEERSHDCFFLLPRSPSPSENQIFIKLPHPSS